MEPIAGYDEWKTTPPEPDGHPVSHCSLCGNPLYDGDSVMDVFGDMWCDKCVEDARRIL